MRRIDLLTWTAAAAVALTWGTARADDTDSNLDLLAFQVEEDDPRWDPMDPAAEPEAEPADDPEWEPSGEAEVGEVEVEADVDERERAFEEDEEARIARDEQIRFRPEERGLGLGIAVGGGVRDFTGDAIRDATNTGGAWDARVTLGTRNLVGLEAAYSGSANGLDTLGVENNAVLLSNGVTGLVRVNVLPDSMVQPYVAGGAAWRRYEVTNTNFNTSALEDTDNVLEVPAAAGVAYRVGQFIGDLRGTYRFAFEEALLPTANNLEAGQGLDNWDVTLTVGYEFGGI